MNIKYTIEIEQEEIPIRGNIIDTGDDAYDREVEDDIINRLYNGDTWAWCCVSVTGEWCGLTHTEWLGGCTYTDEADFLASGYYQYMCADVAAEIEKQAKQIVKEYEA